MTACEAVLLRLRTDCAAIPLGMRSANKRGRLVAERLIWVSSVAGTVVVTDDNFGEWFDHGERLVAEIRDMVHGHLDPESVDPGESSHWLKYGRAIDEGIRLHGGLGITDWLNANRDIADELVEGVVRDLQHSEGDSRHRARQAELASQDSLATSAAVECPVCGKEFPRQSYLERHLAARHSDEQS